MKKVGEEKYRLKHPTSGYDKHFKVKKFILPNGVAESFFVDTNRSSVQIFPLTTNNEVITVVQFRPGSEKNEIELPGGGIDHGEDHAVAARRELREETGHTAEELTYLGSVPYNPYSEGVRHLYVALGCEKVGGLDLDPNEFLTVKVVPLEAFKDLMRSAKVRGFDCAYMALDKLNLL